MKGLSAKVFRTYNASVTLETELPSAESLEGLSIADKIIQYNAANRQVAILCNHQKTVSNAALVMFESLTEKLETLNRQRGELMKWKALAKKSQSDKIPLKVNDTEIVEGMKLNIEEAVKLKEKALTEEAKLEAVKKLEEARAALKADSKRRFDEKHMYTTAPNERSLEGRIEVWTEAVQKCEIDFRNRDENKEVALGTSKINYMDPRISVAWCKRCEVPIDKVFAKTLRDKFNWAMAVPPEWVFE
mmetsp:Transcript_35292/g.77724  ORF Transcript_35292/g.77724 Transcript_35292/m.77724 type:complete len:246 (+) Transcript_35292:1245-1982(+)